MRAALSGLALSFLLVSSVSADTSLSGSSWVVAAAGNVQGGHGTWFHSDIRVSNMTGDVVDVTVMWLPSDPAGEQRAPLTLTLAPYQWVSSERFVEEILGVSGLGSIVFRPVGDTDAPLPSPIHVSSRVWTLQPGTEGSVSASLPGVMVRDIVHDVVAIMGHRRDERFRTNVGVLNLDQNTTHRFTISVSGATPTALPEIYTVDVPPSTLRQIALVGPADPALRIDVQVEEMNGGGHGSLWLAYASTVDNITGDSWTSMGYEIGTR